MVKFTADDFLERPAKKPRARRTSRAKAKPKYDAIITGMSMPSCGHLYFSEKPRPMPPEKTLAPNWGIMKTWSDVYNRQREVNQRHKGWSALAAMPPNMPTMVPSICGLIETYTNSF